MMLVQSIKIVPLFSIAKRLIFVINSVTSPCYCNEFNSNKTVFIETVSLADAAHREVQRRTEASVDHAAGLPPDIVAVLTMFDALERQKEESHNTAHKRFADAITRFFDKLQTEETKYNNRMEELQVGFWLFEE